MNLTDNEKKLFSLFLDDYAQRLSSRSCNDLTNEMRNCLSKEGWNQVSKQYHEWNGDSENYNERYSDCMMDFMVLYYLRRKTGLL